MTIHGPAEFVPARQLTTGIVARAADSVIAISHWAAEATRRAAERADLPIHIVGMGVDGEYLSAPTPIVSSAPMVCVARLEPNKGHDVLLDAVAEIDVARRSFRIDLIGDGTSRAVLEAKAARLGLANTVRFCGWLEESAVRSKLDSCRFLILPSRAEGLPVVIMEAFARARPVIATDVAGISELVEHGRNGFLVPPEDAGSLARAIETMNEMSPDHLLELGMRGRLSVEDRFDSYLNAMKLVSVWNSIKR